MKTKTLTIRVKNGTAKKQTITLFKATFTYTLPNFGLPEGVSVTGIFEPGKREVSYQSLLASIHADPLPVHVVGSTNNRQLAFYTHQWHKPEREAMEPGLTKDGKARREKRGFIEIGPGVLMYSSEGLYPKWNPAKWNIADTHETFMLDIGFECELSFKPHQEFELELQVYERPRVVLGGTGLNLEKFNALKSKNHG